MVKLGTKKRVVNKQVNPVNDLDLVIHVTSSAVLGTLYTSIKTRCLTITPPPRRPVWERAKWRKAIVDQRRESGIPPVF